MRFETTSFFGQSKLAGTHAVDSDAQGWIDGVCKCRTILLVSALVDEVLSLLEVTMEERHISVSRESELIGLAKVQANRSLLRTAFLNVLHNALKFSPNNSTLTISYSRSEAPAPMLLIAFQDEGPGIASDDHQRVFERFFTSTAESVSSKSGSGLGLSVAKLVIDRMGEISGLMKRREPEPNASSLYLFLIDLSIESGNEKSSPPWKGRSQSNTLKVATDEEMGNNDPRPNGQNSSNPSSNIFIPPLLRSLGRSGNNGSCLARSNWRFELGDRQRRDR